jgi:hypothetical protein
VAGLLHRLPTPNVSLPPSPPKPSPSSGGFRRCVVRIWWHVACQGSVTRWYITSPFLPLHPAKNTTVDSFPLLLPSSASSIHQLCAAAKTVNEQVCKSVKLVRVIIFSRNFFPSSSGDRPCVSCSSKRNSYSSCRSSVAVFFFGP